MTITLESNAQPRQSENPQAVLVRIIEQEGLKKAIRPLTGAVLATAQRRGENADDPWCGWAVTAPGREPVVVISPVLARQILVDYAVDALTRCARCGRDRSELTRGLSRGLCHGCHSAVRRTNTVEDYPRITRRRADVVEDYNLLRTAGVPDDQIAQRLGYAATNSLFVALRRAGVR